MAGDEREDGFFRTEDRGRRKGSRGGALELKQGVKNDLRHSASLSD